MKKTDHTKFLRTLQNKWVLTHCWEECKMAQLVRKIVWQFLTELSIHLPHGPVTSLLDTYPRKMYMFTHTYLYTSDQGSLVVIPNKWEQPKCLWTAGWTNNEQSIVYPYSKTLLSNKNQWSIDTYYNTNES